MRWVVLCDLVCVDALKSERLSKVVVKSCGSLKSEITTFEMFSLGGVFDNVQIFACITGSAPVDARTKACALEDGFDVFFFLLGSAISVQGANTNVTETCACKCTSVLLVKMEFASL